MLHVINQFVYRPESMFAAPDFTPERLGLVYEEASFVAADGTALTGWYLSAAKPWLALLYNHGNAGDIRDWVHAAPPFVQAGISLLIWDYRGYGYSAGRPSEEGLFQDGLAAWGWLRARAAADGSPAAILGKSLGSAAAIHTVVTSPADDETSSGDVPAALVLDSAFTSMRELVARHATWVPQAAIPRLFESLDLAPQVRRPTLVVHGGRDMLVPVEEGRRIYEDLAGPKQMKEIPAAGHNDISLYPEYTRWIVEFLREAVGG